MSAPPTVSVVIPTHNRAHLIRRAVHSALWQTFADLEVIVVDDASQDETAVVVGRIADPRVCYVRHDANRGLAAGRNTGIAHAKGTYVAFLDDDDLWLPEKLARQMAILERTSSDVAAVHCRFLVFQHAEPYRSEVSPRTWNLRGNILRPILARSGCILPSTLLVHRTACLEVGGFDESFRREEDFDFVLRVAERFHFEFVPEVLVLYSITPGSLMKAADEVEAAREQFVWKHQRLYRTVPEVWSEVLRRLGEKRCNAGDLAGGAQLLGEAVAADPSNWRGRLRWYAARLGPLVYRALGGVNLARRGVRAALRADRSFRRRSPRREDRTASRQCPGTQQECG